MIWALLFSLILGNNAPLFIFPKLEKHVKQCVVDDERVDELIDFRDISKKERKKFNKYKKKFDKDFRRLNSSKISTPDEFQLLLKELSKERKDFQNVEIEYILKAKLLITSVEWECVLLEGEKGINKEIKRLDKTLKKNSKKHLKALAMIESALHPGISNSKVDSIINDIYSSYETYVAEYSSVLKDKNSIIYQHEVTHDELSSEVTRFNSLYDDIYQSIIDGHFKLLEKTTPRGWKKLIKKTNKL